MQEQFVDNHKALNNLLDSIEKATLTDRDKGTRFETLIKDYLTKEPTHSDRFSMVQTYKEWAQTHSNLAINSKDTGIDLVASNVYDNQFTAIQCKFYAKDAKISKANVDSFIADSNKSCFTGRILITTNDNWSENALNELKQKTPKVDVIKRSDLGSSMLDWNAYLSGNTRTIEKRSLRPYQKNAIDAVINGLKFHERGKLIMACGTGKTFTSLRLAEQLLNNSGLVLFLVPSLSLLSQSLSDWKQQAIHNITAFAVCSDHTTGKNNNEDLESLTKEDELAYPATTNAKDLALNVTKFMPKAKGMTVVFSTYHSMQVISDAQKKYNLPQFDLIICDEAHRTSGGYFVTDEESVFTKIHDNNFISGTKRLYMTATPKIYGGDAKEQQAKGDIVLYSMEDESVFGPTFFNLTFNDAVRLGCLVDYKVIVLAVDETIIGNRYLEAREEGGLSIPNASKVIGCWKALSKTDLQHDISLGDDLSKMKRAVGFAQVINPSETYDRVSSVQFAQCFNDTIEKFKEHLKTSNKDNSNFNVDRFEEIYDYKCDCKHIDGSMSAIQKDALLNWLREEPNDNECKVLFNVRCLSEGVDVPALDAVMFLSPRKSQIDVVQTVGRVMRLAPGKKRGYVIIPIVVPKGSDAKLFLDNNKDFKVVWQVLRALKSIDQNFGSIVDGQLGKIDKNKIEIGWITNSSFSPKGEKTQEPKVKLKRSRSKKANAKDDIGYQTELQFDLNNIEDYIETTIVKKIGNRREWEDWAEDVGQICLEQVEQIKAILDYVGGGEHEFAKEQFNQFKQELRLILNKNLSDDDIIEMLASHIIIKPIIDALFAQYPFTKYNPVALAMTEMVEALDSEGMKKANSMLDSFYDSVKIRMRNIKTTAERQTVILELFEKFFKFAFPKQQEKLGIVYTPVEVVDFINQSVADILHKEFNTSIANKGVHILDPFTGTGTFITRLLQSGLIPNEQLIYKYNNEIHANEIMPLSYYVASMNIESTYYEITKDNNYRPNNITILTDTFEKHDTKSMEFKSQLVANSKKIELVQNSDIRVIVGNPPYSVGQKSANDDNQNERYEELEQRISETYAKESSATLKAKLFDSYIKAYRWASDTIGSNGVIGFVTNANWIESAGSDGMRKCFAQEFSSIYIYHLKGNARTSGEQRQKEKDNVFGSGSRAPIAIVILVKNSNSQEKGKIYFDCVDDYLSREQKLEQLTKLKSILNTKLKEIKPDLHNDWLNQRDSSYVNFIRLDGKDKLATEYAIFKNYSAGLLSSRDTWVYNSSSETLAHNMSSCINFYNSQVEACERGQDISYDKRFISWDRPQKKDVAKGKYASAFDKAYITTSLYRPFFKQKLYYNRYWNNCIYQNNELFPLTEHKDNLCICVSGKGAKSFSVLFTNAVSDFQLLQNMQYFPRYLYKDGQKISAITDEAIEHFAKLYDGASIDADSVFYYIYGILHSKEYREKYANNLVKELPRIPRVASYELFCAFEKAGRKLAKLHADYENVPMYNSCVIEGVEEALSFKVTQLKWGKIAGKTGNAANDKTTLIYNAYITIKNIPLKAQEYIVNQKSALDWIVDRYCVKTDKDSGIVNDCNDYAIAKHNEKYILELILRVITVSIESVDIINTLPSLQIHEQDLNK